MLLDVADAGRAVGLEQEGEKLLIQLENTLHSCTLRGHSAQVLNLFPRQHERILHQFALSFCLHPGHFPVRNLRQAPQ